MIVAFIGHREISDTTLSGRLKEVIENLIVNENADIFLFGSKSKFDDLCYEAVTELKKSYSHIRRIYLRAEFEYISNDYKDYLLSLYEDTEFPTKLHGAGATSYVVRNQIMIDRCDKLVLYFDKSYLPKGRKSGTQLAIEYANRKNKPILNLFAGEK